MSEQSDVSEPEVEAIEPDDLGRRYPSTLGGLFYLLVLAGTFIGIAVATWGEWRHGVRWIGGSLIAAAALRLVLRARDAGMLAVRHRVVDALLLGGVGAVLLVLASTIPNQRL